MIESCYVVTVTSVVSGASGPIYGSYSRTVRSSYSGVTVVPSHPQDLEHPGRFSSSRWVRQSDQFSILNVTNIFSNDLSLKVKEEL